MSVGLLSRYIDDLIAGEEQEIDAYLQALPAGAQDLAPLLLTARAAYKAMRGIDVDAAKANESRDQARQAMADTLGPNGSG
jgi:hypothetical protein